MSYQAMREYLKKMDVRYKKATKKEKSSLLTEMECVTELSRKHLIRMMNLGDAEIEKLIPSGRPRLYDPVMLLPHLLFLWNEMERISPRRMWVALKEWLPYYTSKEVTPQIRLALETMSASTLARMLRMGRAQSSAGGMSTTTPAERMKNQVPINPFDFPINRPGFTQADTVSHCGNSASGSFVSTVTLVDIHSLWTENRAIWTKKGKEVRRFFSEVQRTLPFPLLAVNTDSGSEFLNHPVLKWMAEGFYKKPIQFTRSRPYKKNDNCYVEQRNLTHVRNLFGYSRIGDSCMVPLMNDIYQNYWNPLHNFFLPSFKLKEKLRVGSQIKKKYDFPSTPYQRLLASDALSLEEKEKLKECKKALNPFELKKGLELRLKEAFELLKKSSLPKAG